MLWHSFSSVSPSLSLSLKRSLGPFSSTFSLLWRAGTCRPVSPPKTTFNNYAPRSWPGTRLLLLARELIPSSRTLLSFLHSRDTGTRGFPTPCAFSIATRVCLCAFVSRINEAERMCLLPVYRGFYWTLIQLTFPFIYSYTNTQKLRGTRGYVAHQKGGSNPPCTTSFSASCSLRKSTTKTHRTQWWLNVVIVARLRTFVRSPVWCLVGTTMVECPVTVNPFCHCAYTED